jgi:hypothetical protein
MVAEVRAAETNEIMARVTLFERCKQLGMLPLWDGSVKMVIVPATADFNWDGLTRKLILYHTGLVDSEKRLCAGIRQPARKASFLREGPLASLRRCGHTTGRRFWDGLDTGSIAWTLTSMARS